ncbi:MAG: zinc finger Ran-binding domain-containing protein [bacterium]|nr:zinc finger Ran-binding domain-containing protein [bacterium]
MEAEKLLAMKESVSEKLKKLEAMKPQIREAVYLKIKKEYEQQANEIAEKLEKEKGYLLEEIKKLKEEESILLSKMENYEIEKEELNVRFTLNEFTEEEHLQKKNLLDREINDAALIIQTIKEKRRAFEKTTGLEETTENSKTKSAEEESEKSIGSDDGLNRAKQEPVLVPSEQELPIELQTFDSAIPDTANIPPAEADPNAFKEITIEEKIPEAKESSIDNIISTDILKDETFSLGEDVNKDEKLVNENPLEGEKGKKDDDLSEFAKMLDNQVEPLGTLTTEQSQENIEGLTCPKCGHLNKSDLFNCEKCGAELL